MRRILLLVFSILFPFACKSYEDSRDKPLFYIDRFGLTSEEDTVTLQNVENLHETVGTNKLVNENCKRSTRSNAIDRDHIENGSPTIWQRIREYSSKIGRYLLSGFKQLKEAYEFSRFGLLGMLDYKFLGGYLNSELEQLDPISCTFNAVESIFGWQSESHYSSSIKNYRLSKKGMNMGGFSLSTTVFNSSICIAKGQINLIRESENNNIGLNLNKKLSQLEQIQSMESAEELPLQIEMKGN